MGSIRKITQNLNQSKRIIHSTGVKPDSVPNFQKPTEIISNKYKVVEFPVGDWFQNKKEVDKEDNIIEDIGSELSEESYDYDD